MNPKAEALIKRLRDRVRCDVHHDGYMIESIEEFEVTTPTGGQRQANAVFKCPECDSEYTPLIGYQPAGKNRICPEHEGVFLFLDQDFRYSCPHPDCVYSEDSGQ